MMGPTPASPRRTAAVPSAATYPCQPSRPTPPQGLGNAFVYGWTPRVRRHWADTFPRACAFLRLAPPDESPGSEMAEAVSPGAVTIERGLSGIGEVAPHDGLAEGDETPAASGYNGVA